MAPVGWAGTNYAVLHSFGASGDGAVPSGPLLQDKQRNIYGVTGGGPGQYGYGVAFELTPQANGKWKEAILHTFASGDGRPWGAFVRDQAGNLYGTTDGGPDSNSEAFELSPISGGWSFGALYTNGAGPGILLDKLGNLFGLMGPGDYFGLGAIGELSPGSDGWTYTQLYSFNCDNHCADGEPPFNPVSWDTEGNFYGTALRGGYLNGGAGYGVAYELSRSREPSTGSLTWTYHLMHTFGLGDTPADGQNPYSSVVVDRQGNVYGSTLVGGGTANAGTLFKIAPTAPGQWSETVLFNFPTFANGAGPQGDLVRDAAGALYGVTQGGGSSACQYGCGVVFKLKPTAHGKWKYSVLHTFNGKDGWDPIGLTIDDKGNLFGVTTNGGPYNEGVAFEITR